MFNLLIVPGRARRNIRQGTVAALLICALWLPASCGRVDTPPTPTPVPSAPALSMSETTYVVQRGTVAKTIEMSGRISPIQEMSLHFKASGYVKEVYVRPGDRVQAGDLLAELEMDELLTQIAQAEANLDSAQRLLSKSEESLQRQVGLAELDLSAAKAKLSQAQAANLHAVKQAELALELAREEWTHTLVLRAVTDQEIVSARVTLTQAGNEVRSAQAQERQRAEAARDIAQSQYDSAVAKGKAHEQELKLKEIGIRQAEAQLAAQEAGIDPLLSFEVQRAQLLLDQLQGDSDPLLVSAVNQAELTLAGLRRRLQDAQIVAPMDGQVLSLSLQPGRPVEAFRTVLIVAEPSTLEVTAKPTVDQLQAMAEGQQATIIASADPDRTWSGTVRCLPYPYGTCGTVDDPSDLSQSVRIRLEDGVSDAQLGTLAEVIIVLEKREDTLWLPPDAIRRLQGRTFVMVQDGARQQRVDIEVGIEGQNRVEVLDGLQEGQIVVAS